MTSREPRRPVDGTMLPGQMAQATAQTLREVLPEEAGSTVRKQGIGVSISPVKIVHGLGRSVRGWRATRIRGVVGIALAESASDEHTISIIASGTGTIDIEVW